VVTDFKFSRVAPGFPPTQKKVKKQQVEKVVFLSFCQS
jgi:hypothetical protein